ncbi:MAG: aminodeoxychorismate lyase [Pseudomonadota bacterium]
MRWLSTDRPGALALDDRGLAYGDGLFETLRVADGRIRFLGQHLDRLAAGCDALGMTGVSRSRVQRELTAFAAWHAGADWIKLVVTRGSGARGYAPPRHTVPTAILSAGVLADLPTRWHVVISDTTLPDAGALAGVKHLNRLPQVLARMNLPQNAQEALMCNAAGDLVCGIMSNVFVVVGQQVITPDVSRAGVAGVMRRFVCDTTQVITTRVSRGALQRASEVFVTNALRGVVSLAHADGRTLPASTPVADSLRDALEAAFP